MDSGSASDGESDALSSLLDAETAEHDRKKGSNAGALAGVGSIAGIFLLLGAGMVFKDSIKDFLVRRLSKGAGPHCQVTLTVPPCLPRCSCCFCLRRQGLHVS